MVIVFHSWHYDGNSIQNMITVTIKSFKRNTFLQFLNLTPYSAFEVEYSTCSLKNYEIKPELYEYTAQIYHDFLYVYYCRSTYEDLTEDFKGELWRFHLSKKHFSAPQL